MDICHIEGCTKPTGTYAFECPMHYKRFERYATYEYRTSRTKYKDTQVSFLEKVSFPEGVEACWIWTASKDTAGYGQFKVDGRLTRAHRYSYEYYKSLIPEDMEIDHICEIRDCVNPDHMEPVTKEENIRRSKPNGRSRTI